MSILHDRRGIAPILIVVIVLVVAAALGGGAYLAVRSGVFTPGPPPASDSEIVEEALENLMDQRSANIQADLTVVTNDEEEGETHLKINADLEGVPMPGAEGKSSMQGTLKIDGTFNDEAVAVNAEFRSMPPKTYAKLASLIAPQDQMPFPVDGFLNRWVFFEAKEDGGSANPFQEMIPTGLPEDCKPTPDQEAQAKAYLEAVALEDVAVVTPMGRAQISGEAASVYGVSPDMEQIRMIGNRVAELSGCEDDGELFAEDGMVLQELTVAVGDESRLARQIQFEIAQDTSSSIVGTVTFSSFNEPVSVQEPEGAVSFEQLMKDMVGGMLGMPDMTITTGAEATEGMDGADMEALKREMEQMQKDFDAYQP